MKKLFIAFVVLTSISASAQTLFTYGKDAVTVSEFLRAFKNNNTGVNDAEGLKNYLDLYIASRLKIKEARVKKLDTSAQMKSDLAALRDQVAHSYLIDKATIQKLIDEAYDRSQKDVKLQHVFISFGNGSAEAIANAKKKKDAVDAALKKGTAFHAIAENFSDDPAAKTNGGSLGWITAFSLPYALENLAYNTAIGDVGFAESAAGYHYLKPVEIRPAAGRVRAAQILLAFPPGSTEAQQKQILALADSLYRQLEAGQDFGMLAEQYSNDVLSAAAKGLMVEFGVGEYIPAFEQVVYALKPGEISKPFQTPFGVHIVKMLEHIVPPSDKQSGKTSDYLYQLIEQSDRLDALRTELAKKILAEHGKKAALDLTQLALFTDSVLDGKKAGVPLSIKKETVVLQIGDRKFTAADWQAYASMNRAKADGSNKNISRLWQEFQQAKALEYYTANLEKYNESFRNQMKDFEEGNLFFEIMQRQVWSPAQADSVGQLKYYEKNKAKYNWQKSADAIIFYTPSESAAAHFISHLSSPDNWRSAMAEHADMAADSARIEWSQLPNASKTEFKSGVITPIANNTEDNTYSFAYIVKTYPDPEARTFAQARAQVVSDYQDQMEKNWIAFLRKKYPVTINQKVWEELVKSGKWKADSTNK